MRRLLLQWGRSEDAFAWTVTVLLYSALAAWILHLVTR